MKTKITLILLSAIWSITVFSTSITVTNGNDTGLGSLRAAIDTLNKYPGPHLISFDNSYTINLATALTTIGSVMTIDGQTNNITIVGISTTPSTTNTNSITNSANGILTLKNLTFQKLVSSYSGATTANNCTYKEAAYSAVKVNAVAYTANNCTFENNTGYTFTPTAEIGTAITTNAGAAIIVLNSCKIINNTSAVGAAIYHGTGSGTLTINNCIISGNTNSYSGVSYYFGGGIASAVPTTINNSAIYNNTANRGGGIALLVGSSTAKSSLNMTNCTVSGNSLGQYLTTVYGGGIYLQGAATLLTDNCNFTNCTISGNSTPATNVTTTSSAGGGIEIGGGGSSPWIPVITFTNCTITGNTVQGNPTGNTLAGGGIDLSKGNVVMNYCIVAGNNSNSVSASKDVFCSYLTSTTGRNIHGGTLGWNSTTTTGNVTLTDDISTILNTTLADNGGKIALPDGSYVKTHALVANCVAINPDATGLTGLQTTDQRGFTRDATPDMGAYENGALSAVNQVMVQKQLFVVSNGIISLVDGTMEVIKLNGQVLKKVQVKTNQNISIPSGLYIIRVKTNEYISAQKISL